MTDRSEVSLLRWPGHDPSVEVGLSGLLAAYHLRTEEEKGRAVAGVGDLPDRYRAEVLDPRTAFADDTVLVALDGDSPVGCLVVTAPVEGRAEIKRLWTDPRARGRGVASRLVEEALARGASEGVRVVRLSVWKWRTGAIGLYERLGFTVAASWDERADLVCMERAV